MASVRTERATVRMTERTLRQLLDEVDRIKRMAEDPESEFSFTSEPMPNFDMDMKMSRYEQARRGKILIKNQWVYDPCVGIDFEIDLEIHPTNDEKQHISYKAFGWSE
jgi:hypothetical protein